MKEYHIAVVTRNIEKAAGATSIVKTSKVSSEALAGSIYFKAETLYDGEYPVPAYAPFGYASKDGAGDFWVPKVGDHILLEIDNSVDLPDPRYICSIYTNIRDIHRDFKKNYPWRLGRVTNSGHKLIWDDLEKQESVNFEHKFGQRLFFDKDGSILLHARKVTTRDEKDETKDAFDPNWMKFFLDYTNKKFTLRYQKTDSEFGEFYINQTAKEIKIHDHFLNHLQFNEQGIKAQDKFGNIIELKDGDFKLTAVGKYNVEATGDAAIKTVAKMLVEGLGESTFGNAASATKILGTIIELIAPTVKIANSSTFTASSVMLAGGGVPIARLGDMCVGIGNLGGPVISNITQGSSGAFAP